MYLNEAMATAVQLLLVERNGRKLDEPYTERYIPRLAVAALPLVRQALARHTTLFEGFTRPYLTAARAALGPEADGLQFRYSSIALLGEPEIRDVYLAAVPIRYWVGTQEQWNAFDRLDGLLLFRYQQIHFDDAGELEELMRTRRGFAYIRRAGNHSQVFLLARDNDALREVIARWAKLDVPAREGLIFALE